MSSTMSNTEVQTISKNIAIASKMDERRLVRTSSLEKIRRFNTFICSQQFYLLPSLLAWLRSSQSVLQSATEKTIFFFRSLIFSHFLYKLYQVNFRLLLTDALVLFQKQNWLKIAVYAMATALLAKIGLCFYLLCNTCVPPGLIFLVACGGYTVSLNLRYMFFTETKNI